MSAGPDECRAVTVAVDTPSLPSSAQQADWSSHLKITILSGVRLPARVGVKSIRLDNCGRCSSIVRPVSFGTALNEPLETQDTVSPLP